MSLDGVEFIRRFLMHVLPTGFTRIRHYGFLANCYRKAKLALIRALLQVEMKWDETTLADPIKTPDQVGVKASSRVSLCPKCRRGIMQVTGEMKAQHKRR